MITLFLYAGVSVDYIAVEMQSISLVFSSLCYYSIFILGYPNCTVYLLCLACLLTLISIKHVISKNGLIIACRYIKYSEKVKLHPLVLLQFFIIPIS